MPTFRLLRHHGHLSKLVRYRYNSTSAATQLSDINTTNPKPFKDIPAPTGIYSIPKIGPLFLFKPFSKYNVFNIHELLDRLCDKYGSIMRLGDALVFTSNPKDIEFVYKNEGKYPVRPGLDILEVYLERTKKEKGLGVLNGEKWAKLRHSIQKVTVRPKSALHYIESQSGVAQDLIHQLRSIKPEDLREMLFIYATESIAVVCFNKRLGILGEHVTEEVKEYLENSKLFLKLSNHGLIGFPFYKYFETPTYKKFRDATDKAYGFGKVQIEESLEKALQMKKDGTWNPDDSNLLMTMLADDRLSVNQISSMVLDLLVAGTDSTAKTLELFLDCLSRHPDVQETLFQEILEHMGRHGDLTADNLPKMKYLAACLKESFRINYPVAVGNSRILPNDIVLSGYTVPKGTMIGLHNRRLVKDPAYIKDPTVYRPERWLRDENGVRREQIPGIGLIPFGIGVRNCVGRRFAEQEIYLAVAKIIQNFKLSNKDTTAAAERKVTYTPFCTLIDQPMINFQERT
ncbi:probable cytochrome P450 12a5, mitochondrial [Patella vulgata]|uniref:probable cytochrome P450 12a5, mitochondrial n=1 Tax=Patella vulgata TaxID=6465 RepID=UPI00217F3512|nr:probable cytochrome P450 12a5, mitochondrial [Patella vulgata]